jgi:hypothetical protein
MAEAAQRTACANGCFDTLACTAEHLVRLIPSKLHLDEWYAVLGQEEASVTWRTRRILNSGVP